MSRHRHVVHARSKKHDGGAALHKGVGPHGMGHGFADGKEEKMATKNMANVLGGKAKVRAHRKRGGKVSRAEVAAADDASDHSKGGGCYAKGGKIKSGFIKHPGALHRALHVPKGEKIPEKKLKKAEHSSNPTTKKRAVLAETMKHWHHGKH